MNPELEKILASVVKGEKGAYLAFKQRMADLKGGCSVRQFVLYLCSQQSLALADPEALVDLGFFISESAYILNEVALFDTSSTAVNVKFDPEHFIRILKQAAQTNPGAQCALIHMLTSLDVIQQYCKLPLDRAVDFEVLQRLLVIAKAFRQANDPMQVFIDFSDALICASTLAGEPNYKNACEYLRKSKLPAAHCLLGKYYTVGNGVKQNPTKLVENYRYAAKELHPDGLFNVAWNMHVSYNSDNQFKMRKENKEILRKMIFENFLNAAAHGYSKSQLYLGHFYEIGWGVKKCYRSALECYNKAARQNLSMALYKLGKIYEKGYCDVITDLSQAIRFYQAAAEFVDHKNSANGAMMLLCLEAEYNKLPDDKKKFTISDIQSPQALSWMLLAAQTTVDDYPEDAIYQYSKIIKTHPKSFAAYLGRASVCVNIFDPKHIKQMILDLNKSAELINDDEGLRDELIDFCYEIITKIENAEIKNRGDRLIDLYTIMIHYLLDPDQDFHEYYKYILYRATVCSKLSRLKEAIDGFSIYLAEYDPKNSNVYRLRGAAYQRSNKNKRKLAQDDFRMAEMIEIETLAEEAAGIDIDNNADKKVGTLELCNEPELVDDCAKTVPVSESNSSDDETNFTDCIEALATIDGGFKIPRPVDTVRASVSSSAKIIKQPFSGATELSRIVQAVAGEFCSVSKLDPTKEDQHIYVILFNPTEDIVKVLMSYVRKDAHTCDLTINNLADLNAVVLCAVAKMLGTYYGDPAIHLTPISILVNITTTPLIEAKEHLEKKSADIKQAILNELPEYQVYIANLRKQEQERSAILRIQEFERMVSRIVSMESRCQTFESYLSKVRVDIRACLLQHCEILATIDSHYLKKNYKRRPKNVNNIYDLVEKLTELAVKIEDELQKTYADVAQGQPDIKSLRKEVTEESIAKLTDFISVVEVKHNSVSALYELVKKFSCTDKLSALSNDITKYKRAEVSARAAQQRLLQAALSESKAEQSGDDELVDESVSEEIAEKDERKSIITLQSIDSNKANKPQQSTDTNKANKPQQSTDSNKANKPQQSTDSNNANKPQQPIEIKKANNDRQSTDSNSETKVQQTKNDQQATLAQKTTNDEKEIPKEASKDNQAINVNNKPKAAVHSQATSQAKPLATHDHIIKPPIVKQPGNPSNTVHSSTVNRNAHPSSPHSTDKSFKEIRPNRNPRDAAYHKSRVSMPQAFHSYRPYSQRSSSQYKEEAQYRHQKTRPAGAPSAYYKAGASPSNNSRQSLPRKINSAALPSAPARAALQNQHNAPTISPAPSSAVISKQHNAPSISPAPSSAVIPKQHNAPSISSVPSSAVIPKQHNTPTIPSVPSSAVIPKQHNAPTMSSVPSSAVIPKQHNPPTMSSVPSSAVIPKQHNAPTISPAPSSAVIPKQHNAPSIPLTHSGIVIPKSHAVSVIPHTQPALPKLFNPKC